MERKFLEDLGLDKETIDKVARGVRTRQNVGTNFVRPFSVRPAAEFTLSKANVRLAKTRREIRTACHSEAKPKNLTPVPAARVLSSVLSPLSSGLPFMFRLRRS